MGWPVSIRALQVASEISTSREEDFNVVRVNEVTTRPIHGLIRHGLFRSACHTQMTVFFHKLPRHKSDFTEIDGSRSCYRSYLKILVSTFLIVLQAVNRDITFTRQKDAECPLERVERTVRLGRHHINPTQRLTLIRHSFRGMVALRSDDVRCQSRTETGTMEDAAAS